MPVSVTVRPIEPQGKLLGFASVNFGGVVVDDFKVVDGKNGVFLGAPSKPDPGSKFGYRTTARVTDRSLQERLDAAAAEGYNAAVEKLVALGYLTGSSGKVDNQGRPADLDLSRDMLRILVICDRAGVFG